MRKIIAYKNAKLRHREGLYDIVTEGEKIIGIAKDSAGKYSDAEIVDLGGRLVCEPYVESHIHLDYVYTADIPAEETASGTLFEAIEKWSGSKHQLSKEDIKKRAYKGILTEMRNGVQYIRTHVDVTDPEFTAFQAMLEVKEDGVKSVKKAIELASRHDKLVDIHCDETDDDQSRFVEMIAAEAYFSGLKDRVTASHTCAMGSYNNAYAFKLMSKLEQSGIMRSVRKGRAIFEKKPAVIMTDIF